MHFTVLLCLYKFDSSIKLIITCHNYPQHMFTERKGAVNNLVLFKSMYGEHTQCNTLINLIITLFLPYTVSDIKTCNKIPLLMVFLQLICDL